jgi:hypothetical protein
VGSAASASAVIGHFVPTRVTAVTNIIVRARHLQSDQQGRQRARWFAKPENQSYFRGPVHVVSHAFLGPFNRKSAIAGERLQFW